VNSFTYIFLMRVIMQLALIERRMSD
jgi:hypothetical protein